MKNIDLMNYLSQFPDDSELSVIVANPDKDVRKHYPIKDFFPMYEEELNHPCFIIGVEKPKPLTDEW